MEDNKENEIFQKISSIINHIFSELKLDIVEDKNFDNIGFENSLKELKLLSRDYKNNELNLFIHFLQKLFLNENGNFEFELSEIYDLMKLNDIQLIFTSLKTNLQKHDFYQFLIDIGEIYSNIYINYGDDFNKIENSLPKEKLTNYECILEILQKCKKKRCKLIYANFDIFFRISYLNEISKNLTFALYINNKIYLSSPNYKDVLFSNFTNELFFKDFVDEELQLSAAIVFFEKAINIYWCNSRFYYDEDKNETIDDFLHIFYDFINNNNITNFIINKKNVELNDFDKKYYEYISVSLQKLFKNFDENAINEFKINLYHFLEDYKNSNESNEFIDLVYRIKETNKLKDDETAIISMKCYDKKFLSKLEAMFEISEKNQKNVINEQILDHYEELILKQIIIDKNKNREEKENRRHKKNKKNKKKQKDEVNESKNELISKNSNININDINNKNNKNDVDINSNQNSIGFEDIDENKKNKNIQYFENKNKIEKENEKINFFNSIESNNNNFQNKIDNTENKIQKIEENKNIKNLQAIPIENSSLNDIKDENDFHPKSRNNKENEIIVKNEEDNDNSRNIYKSKNNKAKTSDPNSPNKEIYAKKKDFDNLEKENSELKESLKNLNEQILQLKEQILQNKNKTEKNVEKLNKEIVILKNDVEVLNKIHERIYFRDISKFFINEFVKKYNIIKGNNLYETCQYILKLDFNGRKINSLKSLMIKIVNHYLDGNQLAHIEYLINKNNKLDKKSIMNKIFLGYNNFMKFTVDEQKNLSKNFKFTAPSYLFKKNS